MRNKFPGICYRCGKRVEPGDGHFESGGRQKGMLGKWRVQHAQCAIDWRGTDKKAGDGRDDLPREFISQEAERMRWDIARRQHAERNQ